MPYLFLTIVLALCFLAGYWGGNPMRDDSDAVNGSISGMRPLTDHLTGCQYLTTGWGGITPRMSDEGRQICREDLTNK